MKRILNMLLLVVTVMAVTACDSDDNNRQNELCSPGKLYLPRDQYPLDITAGQPVVFEWENSKTNNACYQVLFDKEEGDFSKPAYVITSTANGFMPSLEVSSATMSTIVALCGGLPGQTVTVKWTVRTLKGLDQVTGVQEGGSRTILVTMPNTVDPLPATLALQGTATENQAAIRLNAALPVSATTGKHIADRKQGAMECFTQFSEGTFTVKDDLDRYFTLEENGTLRCTYAEESSNAAPAAGIYWVYLDFNTMTWSMKEIEKVVFWNRPWFGAESKQPMTYKGNGVWEIVDFAWNVGTTSQKDTRYHFKVYYTDQSIERWAYWNDDFRPEENPEANPKCFNVYRFVNALKDDWVHSWKTTNDSEGINQLATFRVHMNNADKADYFHERSFKDK